MDTKEIISAYEFQRHYLNLLVEDIPEEKMSVQPGGIVNHPAWQLGHLTVTQDRLAQMLGGKSKLDPDWEKRYGMGSTPSAQGSANPTRADFLSILDSQRKEYVRQFNQLSGEDLAKPPSIPGVPPFFTSLGMFLVFIMMSHESGHLGQIASWRRAMGMPQALSKLRNDQ
jgi:uncharacterized damage-inducible protein DinB